MTFRPPPGSIPAFLDVEALSFYTSIGASTIERMVKDGRFPKPRKNKCGKNLWVWKEVESFLGAPEDETVVELERIREATRRASHG